MSLIEMDNVYTRSDVDNMVASFMENGAAFTAWDITKALGNDLYAPHNEVRDIVHELMQPILDCRTASWERTSDQVTPNGETAWVYHNSEEERQDYLDAVLNPDDDEIPLIISDTGIPIAITDNAYSQESKAQDMSLFEKVVDIFHGLIGKK